ncbi:MAG TPA: hypothetical protein VM889_03635 [Candidatus Thermoplasmatota archaeon]|nr:hypothetical protein [Candidatus Thermoplasmatota archaeon]
MRPWLALLVLLSATVLAGCAAPAGSDAGKGPAKVDDGTVEAPWWPVGAWWDLRFTRESKVEHVRLANFWNDSETHHFWLGVSNRAVAMDHALHDTNPLLGRIHWNILTPHQKGIHAHGMYNFPVKPGDQFGGLMFDHEWSMKASAGEKKGALRFEGTATDGSKIQYDYDPDLQWFSFVEIKDRAGKLKLRVDVTDHGEGAKGAFYFLRGRDYYEGPKQQGTHDETFEVKEEEIPHKSLAIKIRGAASGILRLDFIDPSGAMRHSETLPAQSIDRIVEIPSPQKGRWTLRYAGTGEFQGEILGIGILEYTRTL